MLPHGYSVSLLLSMIPPIWMKIIDPYVDAVMNNEKLTKEKMREIDFLAMKTMIGIASLFTVITFVIL
jgi:hypothetical protein